MALGRGRRPRSRRVASEIGRTGSPSGSGELYSQPPFVRGGLELCLHVYHSLSLCKEPNDFAVSIEPVERQSFAAKSEKSEEKRKGKGKEQEQKTQ